MTDITAAATPAAAPEPGALAAARSAASPATRPATRPVGPADLTLAQKAAIVIAALGTEAAVPILERFDEHTLRNFARGMSGLKKIPPETVQAALGEFLAKLTSGERTLKGGLHVVREMLGQVINDTTLTRILDEVDTPSLQNVWEKLTKVDDAAIATFLAREHPQTSAVVLSKLSPEQAARVLDRLDPDLVKRIVMGLTKTSSLDSAIIEAIGDSVSRDFLAGRSTSTSQRNPAEGVGAIMNYVSSTVRDPVLAHLGEQKPEFAAEVKRRMFTFEDIPRRLIGRDASQVLRAVDSDVLMQALKGGEATSPRTVEFLLANISKRMAEQIREDLEAMGKVKLQDGERCQAEIIKAIRRLEAAGELKLQAEEEAAEEDA